MTKPQNPLLTPSVLVTSNTRVLKTLKILIFLVSMAWMINVAGLAYISYRLFGAGFICHPEGLEEVDRAAYMDRGIDG